MSSKLSVRAEQINDYKLEKEEEQQGGRTVGDMEQSLRLQAVGWMAEGSDCKSRYVLGFCPLHVVQIGCEDAHKVAGT
jgi:hypothetical protein